MTFHKTNLGDFAPFVYGKGLPKDKRLSGEVPVYGSNGIVGTHNQALVVNPVIVIGRKGSVGELRLTSGPSWPIDTTFYAEASEKIDLDFLFYLLQTLPLKTNSDSAVPGLNREYAHSLEVHVPDKEMQTSIGLVLKTLDDKIFANSTISETLEEIAQTIFKSWFIDFDPVKAKMAGEKPVGMDDETAALFPDSMEDSELGPVPKGWCAQQFGDVNNLLMGQSPPGDTYNNDGLGLPFYQGRTDFGVRFPSRRVFCSEGKRIAKTGEVLVSVRAPVGDLNQAVEECVIGRGVASTLHKSGSEAYSYALLTSLKPRLAYYNGEGTVFGAINQSDFRSLKILEPPEALIEAFDQVAAPISEEIRIIFMQNESLVKIRDSLLPRLISGELQIPEEMLVS